MTKAKAPISSFDKRCNRYGGRGFPKGKALGIPDSYEISLVNPPGCVMRTENFRASARKPSHARMQKRPGIAARMVPTAALKLWYNAKLRRPRGVIYGNLCLVPPVRRENDGRRECGDERSEQVSDTMHKGHKRNMRIMPLLEWEIAQAALRRYQPKGLRPATSPLG